MDHPECFISYCNKDVNEDCIKDLLRKLRSASNGIIFHYDKENPPGTNIEDFMKKVLTVDTVIIICSKEYNKQLTQPNQRVNTEFSYIIQRYNELTECKKNYTIYDEVIQKEFNIIPLIITENGVQPDSNKVYPEYLQNNLSLDFKRYTYISPKIRSDINKINNCGGEKASDYQKLLIKINESKQSDEFNNEKLITSIISKTLSTYSHRTITNSNIEKNDKIKKLIENTKAEFIEQPLGYLFCKTKFYNDIKNQNRTVFVGRKGSGKTETIRQFCTENSNKYKSPIIINANDIPLEELYDSFINTNVNIQKKFNEKILDTSIVNLNSLNEDIETMFSYEVLLRYTWLGYIYLQSIYTIACEELNSYQEEIFKKAKKFINDLLNKIPREQRFIRNNKAINSAVSSALYSYSFESCLKFFDDIITASTSNNYANLRCDIAILNTPSNFLNRLLRTKQNTKIFSIKTPQARKSFASTIFTCTKKIFISLDGFDNLQAEKKGDRIRYGDFTTHKFINDFESAWILSLVNVVNQIKYTLVDVGIFELKNKLDMCLMVPYDRYIQITHYKRDGFVYRDQMTSAVYKGVNLYDIFLKRVWHISKDENEPSLDIKNSSDRDIISRKLFEKYKNLPKEINVKLKNGTNVKFPLFLYILRYTFWRPRDIIDYIYAIFKTFFENEENPNKLITEKNIKNDIVFCSQKIVAKLIEEFKDLWTNIKECLNIFCYHNAVMTYSEFCEFIHNNSFNIKLSNGTNYTNTNDIIRFLYDIGIIGLILSKKNMDKIHTSQRQHQVFYSGGQALSCLSEDTFKENSIFINPTLISSYNLKVDTEEILGISNWETLDNIDDNIDYDYLNILN